MLTINVAASPHMLLTSSKGLLDPPTRANIAQAQGGSADPPGKCRKINAAVPPHLRCRGYLQNCFLQFLHINRLGEMSREAGAAASLQIFLHPITADGDSLGIADL